MHGKKTKQNKGHTKALLLVRVEQSRDEVTRLGVDPRRIVYLRQLDLVEQRLCKPGMRPVGGNKELYAFSGPCTIFTYSCSARKNPYEFCQSIVGLRADGGI